MSLGLLPLPKYAYGQIAVMLSSPNFLSMGAKVPRNESSMERKFLGHSLLKSESSTGAKVPWSKSSWTFHSMAANVPGNESSICGLFTRGNVSAEERKVQIPLPFGPIFLMFIIFLTRVRYKTVLILIIDTSDLVIRTTPNQSVTSAVFCVLAVTWSFTWSASSSSDNV